MGMSSSPMKECSYTQLALHGNHSLDSGLHDKNGDTAPVTVSFGTIGKSPVTQCGMTLLFVDLNTEKPKYFCVFPPI